MPVSASSKSSALYYTALAMSIWFLFTCPAWTYMINVIISFPFGIAAFVLWLAGRKANKQRYRKIGIILLSGLILSSLALCYFLIFD